MSTYSRANTKAAWYEDNYPGSVITPNAGVLHTTEGFSLPSYDGGAIAPNYTAVPNFEKKRLDWFAHFPDERSSRALVNLAGGVETNTLNVVQVELVGTCNPQHQAHWSGQRAGVDYIYWPEAPDWAIRDLAAFLVDMNQRHGIKLQGPSVWEAYPQSYGADNGCRFRFRRWRNFYGWCGHEHVPENDHGDPGALPFAAVLNACEDLLGTADTRQGHKNRKRRARHAKPTRVQRARRRIRGALGILDKAVTEQHRTGAVKKARNIIRHAIWRVLPPK